MSYAISSALQTAIYQRLSGDATLGALVGMAIYDAVPSGPLPALYVTLGQERVRDRSDMTGAGAEHDLSVHVISDAPGFQQAKEAAAAISDALVDAGLSLTRGTLVGLRFLRARALRDTNAGTRRIELTFRARVDDN